MAQPGFIEVPSTARTEAEVAALTIAALLEEGVISRDPKTILRAAHAVGLTVDHVRNAWKQLGSRRYRPSGLTNPAAERTVEDPAARKIDGRSTHPRSTSNWRINSSTGKEEKRCSRCRQWKAGDPTAFAVKNRTTGQLTSMCRACRADYARERYLSLKKIEQLNSVSITFESRTKDDLVCAKCHEPIKGGEDAEMHGEVFHLRCV